MSISRKKKERGLTTHSKKFHGPRLIIQGRILSVHETKILWHFVAENLSYVPASRVNISLIMYLKYEKGNVDRPSLARILAIQSLVIAHEKRQCLCVAKSPQCMEINNKSLGNTWPKRHPTCLTQQNSIRS